MSCFSAEGIQRLLGEDFSYDLRGYDPSILFHDLYRKTIDLDPFSRILYIGMKTYLPDNVLARIDRASMANALEVRVPFLDHEFVNFATRLPSNLKLRGLQTKWLLKQSCQKLLPPSIIHRPKKGFGIPVAKWINAELKPLFTEVFAQDKIKAQGIFNPNCIQRLLQEHWSGAFDHRKKLWTLFMFQMWFSRYSSRK